MVISKIEPMTQRDFGPISIAADREPVEWGKGKFTQ